MKKKKLSKTDTFNFYTLFVLGLGYSIGLSNTINNPKLIGLLIILIAIMIIQLIDFKRDLIKRGVVNLG